MIFDFFFLVVGECGASDLCERDLSDQSPPLPQRGVLGEKLSPRLATVTVGVGGWAVGSSLCDRHSFAMTEILPNLRERGRRAGR